MISNQRNKRPIITFGLGRTEIDLPLGQTVKVWQNEIYNGDEYVLRYDGIDKPVYGFELTPDEVELKQLKVSIISNDGKVLIQSNEIELNVILTADNTTITADTTLITADNG